METNTVKKTVLSSFLNTDPEAASVVLMRSDPDKISQFILENLTAPLIKTLSLLPIDLLEQSLALLEDKVISDIINQLQVSLAASIFHQWSLKERFNEERLSSIVSLLDTDLAILIKKRLQYSVNTVGSLMTSIPFSVKENLTAGETLILLKKDKKRYCRYVFVTGENLNLIGAIPFKEIFYANEETLISTMMEKNLVSLNPEDGIKETFKDPNWKKWDILPVINSENNLIGIIRYETIEAFMLSKGKPNTSSTNEISFAGNAIAEVFHIGIASTVSALLHPLDRIKKP